MTISRLFPIFVAALLLGGVAHASDFSHGSARLLADNSTPPDVSVTISFTDRGHARRETAEGGDTTTTHDVRTLRGADTATPSAPPARHVAPDAASPKAAEASSADAPHGISISPATAIKRPSYRWQSLVPGTIK
ncbi:MAG TPA: hypothetical protein VHE32_08455 [Rhodanobacteraceae bacterium]|jgi:hypothetical protein|nr:hypothetical protein [Rhodanobacteraceae bacterium]